MAARKSQAVKRSVANLSSWHATARVPHFSPLAEDANTDVCVIGAGISGLTTAYLLAKARKKVVVIEDGEIGSGETGNTTAHLVNAFDDRYSEMEKLHGADGMRIIAESHSAAIDLIEQIVKDEKIACDFRRLDGYLFLAPGDDNKTLSDELDAARRTGLPLELVRQAPLDSFDTGKALLFPRQATFHPLKYLSGLANALVRMGGTIHTHTHVEGVHDGTLQRISTTNGKNVWADDVVVATNSPINTWVKMHSKQAPYRTFVVALRVPKGAVPDMLLWDTGDPYHYVRLQRIAKRGSAAAYDLLIVGGEDHKTGQEDDAEKRFSKLEAWARTRFPKAGRVVYRWSGQVMEPVDGVGYAGRTPDAQRSYMITGDSGNGMTHGTLGAKLVSDLILGRENKWTKLYDPSRVTFKPGALKEFAKENLNVAAQYADFVRPGDVDSTREIQRGEGAVVTRGTRKIAMYRDETGELHERSAVCTHLGCVVSWNSGEKSWDCPCHGSRFTPTGEVLNGPASAPLKKLDEEEEKADTREKGVV